MKARLNSLGIAFDPKDFAKNYEKRAFYLQHELANHPLFTWDKLIELAHFLPTREVEINAGDVPISLPEGRDGKQGLSIEETLKRIAELKTWVGLKKISLHPEYRALMDSALDTLRPHIDPQFPGMYEREGFIFISSPHSVTPYHMDPEHNFLFHIMGKKTFTIFDKADREIISEVDIENHYSMDNRKMILKKEMESRGTRLELKPGQAIHVPINAPHHVCTHDEVCISLSVTFRTPRGDQRENVYRVNKKLRNAGIAPTPYGKSGWKDVAKAAFYETYHRLRYFKSSRTARAGAVKKY